MSPDERRPIVLGDVDYSTICMKGWPWTGMSLHDALLDRAVRRPETGCWLWQGSRTSKLPKGYGIIFIAGKYHTTHRVSYALFRAPVPEGLCVLHECDTPLCINPAHLWLGTQADNVADRRRKGRPGRRRADDNLHPELKRADLTELYRRWKARTEQEN
jgi:hypothetical protein